MDCLFDGSKVVIVEHQLRGTLGRHGLHVMVKVVYSQCFCSEAVSRPKVVMGLRRKNSTHAPAAWFSFLVSIDDRWGKIPNVDIISVIGCKTFIARIENEYQSAMSLIPQSKSTRVPLLKTLPLLRRPSPSGTLVASFALIMPPLAVLILVFEGLKLGSFALVTNVLVTTIIKQPESAQREGPMVATGFGVSYTRVCVATE